MKTFKSKTIESFTRLALHQSQSLMIKGKGCCDGGGQEPPDDDPNKSVMAMVSMIVLGG